MTAKKSKKSGNARRQRAIRWTALVAALVAVPGGAALLIADHGRNGVAHKAEPRPAVRLALPPAPKPPPIPNSSLASNPSLAAVERPTLPPPAPAAAPPAALPSPARIPEAPAWKRYAIPAPAAQGRPLIAVVIDDMGLDRKRSARAAALPAPLTLSWLPYAQDVSQQAAAARSAGHETLLHVPMQPLGRENPGPNALTIDLSAEEIRRRVAADLALLPETVGLNNHMGSRFTHDARAMLPVVEELKHRGLLFLDSRTTGGSVAATVAREAGVPTLERDVFLDNEATVEAVRARLAEVETIAKRRGYAVAIGHPHDATLEALDPWLHALAARGFALMPISAVLQYRLDHPAPIAQSSPDATGEARAKGGIGYR